MRCRLLYLMLLLVSVKASAQIVGTSMFLQGAYLEIGMNNNASFGTTTAPPAGYHTHCTTCFPTTALAEVYDYGHDGWAVGTPPYMGDYTYPGSPFEGWELQANVGRTQAFVGGTYNNFAGGSMTGGLTTYSNSGGRIIGNWAGTASAGNLQVKQETRVDTYASAVVITTYFKNLSATPIPGIYYLRSCDPDNDETWPGGGFPTNNTVVYQNTDPTHKVMVSATGLGYPSAAYLALGTKDCRAKAFIYNYWSISGSVDLADLWNQTVPSTYGNFWYTGTQPNQDIGIGLVYNIGTLAGGAEAIISFAYIFNGNTGIDSAFPDPQLVLNGTPLPRSAPPVADYDTLNACDYPGVTIFPVDLRYADDKSWSWATWTWSPAIGLASTTGVTNTINTSLLAGTTTYTITGSDSASGMSSCNRKTFYLTVKTCHDAIANAPCEGDSLKLSMLHDVPGDTYAWWGPVPSTTIFSTSVSPVKFPAALTDAGLYYVVRTRLGVNDTDSVVVTIHPKPILTATSNMSLCQPIAPDLNLNASPTLVDGTYTWTGPNAFTATSQNPTISPFALIDTGYYTVIGTSVFGCRDTATTYVYPGTVAAFTYTVNLGCDADTVIVTNNSTNGNNYTWDFKDGSAPVMSSSLGDLTHRYTVHQLYSNVSLTAQNAHCTNTVTHNIDTRHSVTAEFQANNDTICVNGDSTTMADLSTASVFGGPGMITGWDWYFGDGSAHEITQNPVHKYAAPGIYPVTLIVTDSIGCIDQKGHNVVAIDPILHGLTDTLACLLTPMPLPVWVEMRPNIVFSNYTYEWSPSTNLSSSTDRVPLFSGFGDFTYTITAIAQPYTACPMTHVMTVHSVEGAKLMNVTRGATINYGDHIQMYSSNEIKYMWTPNDGSLDNNNINNPVATPTVTTTYTVYGMDKYGCVDSATVTVVVDSTMTEFVPSGFTPNGDGKNDKFMPTYLKYQKLVEFSVYNRWGQKVFSTANKEEGWDGNFNNAPQDMGVYFYTIIISRAGYSTNQIYKGEVTLIR